MRIGKKDKAIKLPNLRYRREEIAIVMISLAMMVISVYCIVDVVTYLI
jgi:hypothetical protein